MSDIYGTIMQQKDSLVTLSARTKELKVKEQKKNLNAAETQELHEGMQKLAAVIAQLEKESAALKDKSQNYQNNHLRHTKGALKNIELIESIIGKALKESSSTVGE
jgi:predicted RNase H-like nuclease (RuvC/YqgF family)